MLSRLTVLILKQYLQTLNHSVTPLKLKKTNSFDGTDNKLMSRSSQYKDKPGGYMDHFDSFLQINFKPVLYSDKILRPHLLL